MRTLLALIAAFGLLGATIAPAFADDGGQTCFAGGCEYDGSGGWMFDPGGWAIYA